MTDKIIPLKPASETRRFEKLTSHLRVNGKAIESIAEAFRKEQERDPLRRIK